MTSHRLGGCYLTWSAHQVPNKLVARVVVVVVVVAAAVVVVIVARDSRVQCSS